MNNLIERLRKRAEIRRHISTRKSVQEGKPDRIADLLEEAASALEAIKRGESLCNECGYPLFEGNCPRCYAKWADPVDIALR